MLLVSLAYFLLCDKQMWHKYFYKCPDIFSLVFN